MLRGRGGLTLIRRLYAESHRCYGSPRVHAALQAEGQPVGRNRVARLMRCHDIPGRASNGQAALQSGWPTQNLRPEHCACGLFP
jgi:hypothetical protein